MSCLHNVDLSTYREPGPTSACDENVVTVTDAVDSHYLDILRRGLPAGIRVRVSHTRTPTRESVASRRSLIAHTLLLRAAVETSQRPLAVC